MLLKMTLLRSKQHMESGSQISEIWSCFKEYVDKKHIETVAERFVDLCADYGTPDEAFRDALGIDNELDKAITYYLDEDMEDDDWAEDEDF